MSIYLANNPQKEPAPVIAPPKTDPGKTTPHRKDDPSRIPYHRPQVDPRPKA